MVSPGLLAQAGAALGVANITPQASGGQKTVAFADAPSGRTVVKLIELSSPYGAIALERARREVAVLSAISHPNVVCLESGLVELGSPVAAVCWREEYLDGADLDAFLGTLGHWTDAADMARGILAGLTAFHNAGAVHRDLSPRNVRRTSVGAYVVMDPGLARLLAETTITGLADPGTPGYMSPEHVSPAARPTFASDVFGVGILLYEALTGQSPIPFLGDRGDYARRLAAGQAPTVGALRPDLTAAQVNFVDTCLQRQLARRYLDAAEAITELARL
jgi:serine/threonine protein kinase